jgi:hypothetical protein
MFLRQNFDMAFEPGPSLYWALNVEYGKALKNNSCGSGNELHLGG